MSTSSYSVSFGSSFSSVTIQSSDALVVNMTLKMYI